MTARWRERNICGTKNGFGMDGSDSILAISNVKKVSEAFHSMQV